MDAPQLSSMTGFGAGQREALCGERRYACELELRSVNNRGLKVSVRAPEPLSALIPKLEAQVREAVSRGTVYLTLRVHEASSGGGRLEASLLRSLFDEVGALARELNAAPPRLDTLCLVPGVVAAEEGSPSPSEVWPAISEALAEALAKLVAMRRTEGLGLGEDLRAIAAEMREHAAVVEREAPKAVEAAAERLRERISELAGSLIEPGELAREVALLADKADVAEELQRLGSHLDQVEQTLAGAEGPVGRKLEFLAQELLREANTMGNKCRDGALVQRALELKLCVERLKEQLANLE